MSPLNSWLNPFFEGDRERQREVLTDHNIYFGGLEHLDYFSILIGNVIIPFKTLTPSFFRGVGQPPTSIYIYSLIVIICYNPII